MNQTLDPLRILKSDKEREVAQNIADLLRPYSPEVRAQAILGVHKLEAERSKLEADLTHYGERRKELGQTLDELKTLNEWFDQPPRLVLERNDCSRLHRLKEAAKAGRIVDGAKKGTTGIIEGAHHIIALEHVFVVKHDWASAFSNAQDISGEFKLPYSQCVFEFRLDGHNVILWGQEFNLQEYEEKQSFTCFIEMGEYWYSPPMNVARDDFMRFAWDQVRAICIALDAEVATHTVVRAPHKLNEKRTRDGKVPLADFHVIDLAKRHRVANPSGATGAGGRKRLHFRRGHWRHFETSKTWVKWCLVGNPDLGFIHKSYKL
jgi:hypothetical protein